jgi:two-component system sensor histidine kinase HydH
LLIVPLRLFGQVIGLLTVWRDKPAPPLTTNDQWAIQWLTDRTALAIDSSRLYTDLQRSLLQEQDTRRQLVQAETFAAMGRMVATVAHELNNPLQTIRNCLYLIEQEIPADESLHEYFQMAATEFERLSSLVAELRMLQRSRMPLTLKPLNLRVLLDEVYALLDVKLRAQAVEWQLSIETTETEVLGASDQFKQVCLNISLNAIEALHPDGGTFWVSLLASPESSEVGLRFQDSGPGIAPENLSRVFEPLFTTKSNGLGLGLPICYEIVQQHGGRLTVDSPPGCGAVFTIWLPLTAQKDKTV